MNIGQAEKRTGLPAKTIRYYEDIGLVIADRRENGYRDYGEPHIEKLRFVGHARGLGFTIEECRGLLDLYEDKRRASADVKAIAKQHLADIDRKIEELNAMRDTLSKLVRACRGDNRPDCPILDDLAGK